MLSQPAPSPASLLAPARKGALHFISIVEHRTSVRPTGRAMWQHNRRNGAMFRRRQGSRRRLQPCLPMSGREHSRDVMEFGAGLGAKEGAVLLLSGPWRKRRAARPEGPVSSVLACAACYAFEALRPRCCRARMAIPAAPGPTGTLAPTSAWCGGIRRPLPGTNRRRWLAMLASSLATLGRFPRLRPGDRSRLQPARRREFDRCFYFLLLLVGVLAMATARCASISSAGWASASSPTSAARCRPICCASRPRFFEENRPARSRRA